MISLSFIVTQPNVYAEIGCFLQFKKGAFFVLVKRDQLFIKLLFYPLCLKEDVCLFRYVKYMHSDNTRWQQMLRYNVYLELQFFLG